MVDPPSNPQPKKNQFWPPNAELSLLTAVLEIAREPAESYDPRINLFDRIGKVLNKSCTNQEVLGKINELKVRYLKRCHRHIVHGSFLKKTPVFEISEKIWGDEVKKRTKIWKKNAQRTSQGVHQPHEIKTRALGDAKPNSTASVAERNPQDTSKLKIKRPRPHDPTKEEDDVGPENKHKKGNPVLKKKTVTKEQKRIPCFHCGNPGHRSRICYSKMNKKLIKQQERIENSKEISTLQPDTENKRENQPNALISPSFQPGPDQLPPQQAQQGAGVSGNHFFDSHQPSPEHKRMNASNRSQPSVHPHSKQNLNKRSPVPPPLPAQQWDRGSRAHSSQTLIKEPNQVICFNCGNPGHLARNCLKEIEKPTKQQDSVEISKDASTLQPETENKPEEQSKPLKSSSQPASDLAPQQAQRGVKVSNNPACDSHQPFEHKSMNASNGFWPSLRPHQWNRGLPVPRAPSQQWNRGSPVRPPTPTPHWNKGSSLPPPPRQQWNRASHVSPPPYTQHWNRESPVSPPPPTWRNHTPIATPYPPSHMHQYPPPYPMNNYLNPRPNHPRFNTPTPRNNQLGQWRW